MCLLSAGIFAQKPFHYTLNDQIVTLDTTSLHHVEEFGLGLYQTNLGNEGTPIFSLAMDANFAIRGDYSYLSYQLPQSHKKYNVYKPVTQARYVTGSKLEQHFNIYHTQNFSRKSNFSIGFDKTNSPGYYLNQATNNSHFYVNAYGKKIGKIGYNFELNIDYNNLLSSLNGGIVNDSDFVNDVNDIRNRELLEVNLENASQQLRRWSISYNHTVNLVNIRDTNNGKFLNFSLLHEIEFLNQARDYYDSLLNLDYYNVIFTDSIITNDKVSYKSFSNLLGVKFEHSNNSQSSSIIGVRPSFNWYKQGIVDTAVIDLDAVIDFDWSKNALYAKGHIDYLLNDVYTNNDYDFQGEVGYYWLDYNKFNIYTHLHRDRVALDLQIYEANNIKWSNTFQKQSVFHYGVSYAHDKKWKKEIAFNYYDVKNPFYFTYNAKPNQIIGFGQVLQTKIIAEGMMGKRWWMSINAMHQNFGGYNVFMMPNYVGNLALAYNFKMFKKKMDLSIGFKATYFSKYLSKDFDPITGQFFISSEQEIGGYPYADVFIKGRVQRATFFVMSTHPHQGLLGYNYFLSPHYPGLDRVIRVGVAWMFVN